MKNDIAVAPETVTLRRGITKENAMATFAIAKVRRAAHQLQDSGAITFGMLSQKFGCKTRVLRNFIDAVGLQEELHIAVDRGRPRKIQIDSVAKEVSFPGLEMVFAAECIRESGENVTIAGLAAELGQKRSSICMRIKRHPTYRQLLGIVQGKCGRKRSASYKPRRTQLQRPGQAGRHDHTRSSDTFEYCSPI